MPNPDILNMATSPPAVNGHKKEKKPHIVLVIPRGEAVRNFLFSDTLPTLHQHARVTLLSVLTDEVFMERFEPYTEEVIPLKRHREHPLVKKFRFLIHEAHFRWLWSEVAKNTWELRKGKAETPYQQLKRVMLEAAIKPLANRPTLEALSKIERALTWKLRPNDHFVDLFKRIQPDLVFNCSHIHGHAGELPMKVAQEMGIATAGFIFSWDNLTSRSRIFVEYDDYVVWHDGMRDQLLSQYPQIDPKNVHVTGTPQFDYHFKPEYWLSREELCAEIGIDPKRPFILYTTGLDKHFPDEHRTVERVIELLNTMDLPEKPQLVVRTYVKGTSDEMRAIAARKDPDVVFPPVKWDAKWYTPHYDDLSIYTSLLRECCMGINPASTVTLELMMHDKPVMNLGFDPPGSNLPHRFRWIRHINFDHYRPVAESGGTMVAWTPDDLEPLLRRGLTQPEADSETRHCFIEKVFGDTLDGQAAKRIAERLVQLAQVHV